MSATRDFPTCPIMSVRHTDALYYSESEMLPSFFCSSSVSGWTLVAWDGVLLVREDDDVWRHILASITRTAGSQTIYCKTTYWNIQERPKPSGDKVRPIGGKQQTAFLEANFGPQSTKRTSKKIVHDKKSLHRPSLLRRPPLLRGAF